jgi:hypothetical protein
VNEHEGAHLRHFGTDCFGFSVCAEEVDRVVRPYCLLSSYPTIPKNQGRWPWRMASTALQAWMEFVIIWSWYESLFLAHHFGNTLLSDGRHYQNGGPGLKSAHTGADSVSKDQRFFLVTQTGGLARGYDPGLLYEI